VPYYSLRDALGLCAGGAEVEEEREGEEAAVEFEGEVGGVEVWGCGADVVEEGCEEEGGQGGSKAGEVVGC
jgi:hypothetical protein